MQRWIGAVILGVTLVPGPAGAKPPKEYADNVTYCINQQLETQGGGPHQESIGRIRKDCEDFVDDLDRQFRHEPAYVRGSIDQRREILSSAIDCKMRWLGRPGTGFQDCVRQVLDASAPPE